MKRFLLLSFLLATSQLTGLVFGQCNPQVHGTVFAFGITDSVTPAQFVPGPFYVCDNATLYYYGNNPDTVFLEGSARLRVGYAWNLVVYMRNNSNLAMDTTAANWQGTRIAQIHYDPSFTTFQDTAGVTILALNACPAMSYDYSLFPSGVSPCSLPSASEKPLRDSDFQVYPNPAGSELHVKLTDPRLSAARVLLMDSQGRLLRSEVMDGVASKWDVSGYPRGIYLLGIETNEGMSWQRLTFQ